MDIRNLLKVLILICAVICASAGRKRDEKSLENSVVDRDGSPGGEQNDNTVATSPKDGNYKLSYANYEKTWRNYKREHNKKYTSTDEEKSRFAIFMKNVKKIEAHNMEYHLGQSTYWMDINNLSDWTEEEFQEWLGSLDVHTRSKREAENNIMTYNVADSVQVPEAIDWSKKGFVTQVKDQKTCGSCYAFSTTGSMEGQWFRKTGKLINLSEQQIVDCSTDFGNNGCKGGSVTTSFRYIVSVGGLQSEATYSYTAKNESCKFNKALVVAQIEGYYVVFPTERALKSAVGIHGPVSVLIHANDNFEQFGGGIYDDPTCEGMRPNHAVLVVGYDRNSDGKDYWIVKNCWGSTWGDKWNGTGYIKVARNTGGLGMCGIAGNGTFPAVPDQVTSSRDDSGKVENDAIRMENNAFTVLLTSTLVFLKFTQLDLCF